MIHPQSTIYKLGHGKVTCGK